MTRFRLRANPLWSKAPLLLVRYPALFAALASGFLLLAVAVASNPFFVSAAGTAALATEIEDATEFGAGATLSTTAPLFMQRNGEDNSELWFPSRGALLRDDLAGTRHLGKPVFTMLAPTVAAAGAETATDSVQVRFLARTGALAHIRKLEQASAEGVWMPDTTAAQLGVGAGDSLAVGLGTASRTIRVPIAGTYRALRLEPPTPYWRSLTAEIRARPPDYAIPPSLLVADASTVTSLMRRLGLRTALYRWEFPLADLDLTVPEAKGIAAGLKAFQNRLNTPGSRLNNAFACPGLCSFFGEEYEYSSLLPLAVSAAEDTTAAVAAPVDLLANASSLVAFALIAAAGAFVTARRRQEVNHRRARGVGAGIAAARIFVEAFVPATLGALAGVVVAYGIVEAVGPTGRIEPGRIVSAGAAVFARAPAALLLLALVAALVSRSRGEQTGHSRLARIPWEAPVLIVAALLLWRLLDAGALSGEEEEAQGPSAYLLLFPLFFTAGAAGAGARLVGGLARLWRDHATRTRSRIGYLAAHRLAGSHRLVAALVTACAVAFGTFIYAETIVSSYRETVRARSLLSVGSDVSGTISFDRETPAPFPFPITKVSKLTAEGQLASGRPVDLVAVESRSFARAAFWDGRYSSSSLESLMAVLRTNGQGVPAILVGDLDFEDEVVDVRGVSVPVRAVGEARAFPGTSRSRPILVVDSARLEEFVDEEGSSNPFAGPSAVTELWVKGEPQAAARALESSSARPFPLLTAEEVRDTPGVIAFTRAFALLEALGLAAGLLVLVVVVLYLQARQRARIVSHRLSLRMGLTRARHLAALWLEIVIMLLVSAALAAGLALLAARIVLTQVEPLASLTPVPLFEAPTALIAGTLVASSAVAGFAAVVLDRASRRARIAEVLRRAD
jgi:hypothetical protein